MLWTIPVQDSRKQFQDYCNGGNIILTLCQLEIMMRKKQMRGVDGRQILMLENSYYQCNPPNIEAVHVKSRTPLELYLRHLMYRVLSKQSAADIARTLRKLDWADSKIVSMLSRFFIKIWKIRYSNLHLAAYLLAQLDRYHPKFTTMIVFATLDSLKLGMELNFYKVTRWCVLIPTRKIKSVSVFPSLSVNYTSTK